MRHADAGYADAIDCAREYGLDLPMIGARAMKLGGVWQAPPPRPLTLADLPHCAGAAPLMPTCAP